MLQYFKYCIFSDEAGASKPSPRIFEQAAQKLKTPLSQIVHIGDRESNDIAGPLAMGMQAILYTGLIDQGSQNTQPPSAATSPTCPKYCSNSKQKTRNLKPETKNQKLKTRNRLRKETP